MKKGLKKAVTALMITTMFTLTGSISSQATKMPVPSGQTIQTAWIQLKEWYNQGGKQENPNSWLEENGNWYYFNLGETIHTNWLKENENWYYILEDGTKLIGWLYEDENWYYLKEDGTMCSGWLELEEKWYYFDSDGKMVNGWLNLDGAQYYFDKDGTMLTDWLDLDGSWYYLNADGKMTTGWLDLAGNRYYFNADGKMATDWLNLNEAWYYFDTNGKMMTGWLDLDGSWYYLNADGKMATDWLNLNGVWYYLNTDGKMAVDTWIALNYVDANGVWIEDRIPEQSVDTSISTEVPSIDNVEEEETTESLDSTETIPDHTGSEITTEYIKERLENLRVKYPDGMYWNHMGYTAKQKDTNYYSETVTSIPCNHGQYGTDYCNSYINYSLAYVIGMQCDGFARKLSDEIFGTDTKKTDYVYSFDAVKVGDYLRYNNTHTVLVVGKDANGIQVAECNIGGTCVIRWGRRITREELDRNRSITCFTRY